ncbi:ATP-binding cassette domain-containing protein [Nonomuraea polychroma]|uniref:ATP-binding cassette domain-containing protein n=1 Tax=Nonomuraea polychroma TaxID=46176 RepID=UPI003D90992A
MTRPAAPTTAGTGPTDAAARTTGPVPAGLRPAFTAVHRRGPAISAELDVEASEVMVLFGPSGGGKTTILRALAGLHTPATGRSPARAPPGTTTPRQRTCPPSTAGSATCSRTTRYSRT